MLVLSRRPGEVLIIETSDGIIKIQLFPNYKIGIEAPKKCHVVREELLSRGARNKI